MVMSAIKKLLVAGSALFLASDSTCSVAAMIVFVKKYDGTTFAVDMEPTETIGTLKSRFAIAKACMPPRAIGQDAPPLDRATLIFNGTGTPTTLDDDTKSLASYGIRQANLTIYFSATVAARTYEIFVKHPTTGATITLDGVKGATTINEVVQMLNDKIGSTGGDVRLIYGGKQLQEDKTLKDYAIAKGATLHLVLRMRGGTSFLRGSVLRVV